MHGEFEPRREKPIKTKIELNTSSSSEHVPDIEPQIHDINEISRSRCHTLPLKHVPRVILVSMLMNCTLCLKTFTQKVGFSTPFSPKTIFTVLNFYYNKHFRIQFGQYEQVHQQNTPINSQLSRIYGVIYLGPTGNL